MYEIDMSNRILGFNPDADLDYLEFIVNNRHSSFGFNKGYTLEELGVDKFVTPLNNSIKTPTQLMEIYNTNKEDSVKLSYTTYLKEYLKLLGSYK